MTRRRAGKATYNPKTKQFYGFPDDLRARPGAVPARASCEQTRRESLSTWEDVAKGRPEARRRSGTRSASACRTRLDSNMLLIVAPVLLRRLHPERGEPHRHRPGSNSKGAIEALKSMRDIYQERHVRRGLRAGLRPRTTRPLLAGRLSMALNAISIDALGRAVGNHGAVRRHSGSPRSRAARMRARQRARDGHLPRSGSSPRTRRRRRSTSSTSSSATATHFIRSRYYNFPPWTERDQGGFKDDPQARRRRTRTSRRASTRS